MNAVTSKTELETLCAEQAVMIRQLNYLVTILCICQSPRSTTFILFVYSFKFLQVDQCKHEHGGASIAAQGGNSSALLLLKDSDNGVMSSKELKSEGNMHVVIEHEVCVFGSSLKTMLGLG